MYRNTEQTLAFLNANWWWGWNVNDRKAGGRSV